VVFHHSAPGVTCSELATSSRFPGQPRAAEPTRCSPINLTERAARASDGPALRYRSSSSSGRRGQSAEDGQRDRPGHPHLQRRALRPST
jgi:hypothetical protein